MEELFSYRQELLSALEAHVTRLARIDAGISTKDWYLQLGPDQPTPHYFASMLMG